MTAPQADRKDEPCECEHARMIHSRDGVCPACVLHDLGRQFFAYSDAVKRQRRK